MRRSRWRNRLAVCKWTRSKEVTSSTSTFDEKYLQHLDVSEKMQLLVDGQKATSESGSTVMNKEHVLLSSKHQVDAQEHMLALQEEEDDSEKVRLQKKKVKKRKSSELEKMKKEKQVVLEEPTSKASYPLRWHAYFSTTLLLQIQKAPYKGSVLLDREVNRVTLLDDDETDIDHCYIKEGELIYPGLMLEFRCHKAKIGEQIIQANKDISLPTTADEGEGELPGSDDEREKRNKIKLKRNKKGRKDAKKMNKLKRKRSDEDLDREKELRRKTMTSPQAKLVGSSIGMFARVASLRRRSESPFVPNVTTHFPAPNIPRVGADFSRRRPRKLKSGIWKDFIPIYEHGRVTEGQCKHCNEVFPSSKSSGTNHIRRHLRKCVTRRNMHEMVDKMRASASPPQVSALDSWKFTQEECRRNLANMIVHHGLPFSIVEYTGFKTFIKI
ncbi:unnamed protein product [Alopecurus aequalis]